MEKITDLIQEKFLPIANKISSNRYLKTIADGSMSLLGVLMLGAVFTIFSSFAWEPYQAFLATTHLDVIFAAVPNVTTDLLAIYMAFSVAYNGARTFGIDRYAFNTGLMSLVSYMVLTPLNSTDLEGVSFFDISYLGSKGVFLALIVALITVKVMQFFINKNISIKLPDSVPPQVTNSFIALIPAVVIVGGFALVKLGFSFTSFQTANTFIYTMLQTPLQSLAGSLPAFLFLIVVAQIMWFFGIHGSMTVLPVLFPIFLGYLAENTEALASGAPIPNPINFGLYDLACLGGCGATIGLCVIMFFFSKSERYKTFSRIALPCGIFGVNEPVVYGFPLMLNFMMLIPFIVTPLVITLIGYALIQMGIITPCVGVLGMSNLPPFFHGLMQGSVSFGIYELAAVVISMIIYFPFFKVLDQQAYQEEQEAAKAAESEAETEVTMIHTAEI